MKRTMQRALSRFVACLVALCMICAMTPTAALAAPGDGDPSRQVTGSANVGAAVGFKGTGSTAVNETSVYLKAVDSRFKIAAHSGVGVPDGPSADIWVQVENQQGAFAAGAAEWWRVALDADGNPVGQPERMGASGESATEPGAFYWHPVGSDALTANTVYRYWAVVTDGTGSTASNEDDPIMFVNKSGYRSTRLTWSDDGDVPWKWFAEGAAYSAHSQGDSGVDGLIHKDASLSVSPVRAGDSSGIYSLFEQKAASMSQAGAASQYQLVEAWSVNVADAAPADAFIGTILGAVDVTDLIAEGDNGSELALVWYDQGTGQVLTVAGAEPDDEHPGAPWNAHLLDEGDQRFLGFCMPGEVAGVTGDMGVFGLIRLARETFTVSASVGAAVDADGNQLTDRIGGSVQVSGGPSFEKGSQPVINIAPDPYCAVHSIAVTNDDGTQTVTPTAPNPAAGVLAGNSFTLAPLASDVQVEVRFQSFGQPPVGTQYTVGLSVGSAHGSVEVTDAQGAKHTAAQGRPASGVKVDALKDALLTFLPETGYEASKVTVTYTSGPQQGASIPYTQGITNPFGLGKLTGDAQIAVEFGPSSPGPAVPIEVSAEVIPAGAGSATVNGQPTVQVTSGAATFTVAPNAGYEVKRAYIEFADGTKGREYQPYEMNGNSITVTGIVRPQKMVFELKETGSGREERTIRTEAGPGGRITADQVVWDGDAATVWFFPDAGMRLDEVAVDGKPLADALAEWGIEDGTAAADGRPFITFGDVGADHLVRATFVAAPGQQPQPSVDISAGAGSEGGGTVSPAGESPVYQGTDQEYTFHPQTSWMLDRVTITNRGGDAVELFNDESVPKELKDNSALLAASGLAYDDAQGCYTIDVNGQVERIRFEYDADGQPIKLMIGNIQMTHDLVAGYAHYRTVDVLPAKQAIGGHVVADHADMGAEGRHMKWKTRKGDLVLLMVPDEGYGKPVLTLDGQPVAADQVVEASDQDMTDYGATEGVRAVAPAAKGYLYRVPVDYLKGDSSGDPVVVSVDFPRLGSSGGATGDGNGSGDSSGGSAAGDGNGGGSANSPVAYTVKASVKGGHGAIVGAEVQKVPAGQDCTISFKPDIGYVVGYLTRDGERAEYSGNSLTFEKVSRDHEVVVEFIPKPYAGNNTATVKTLRRLQALARTGDLAAPVAMALLAVAFGASGAALLVSSRRKKNQERSEPGHAA